MGLRRCAGLGTPFGILAGQARQCEDLPVPDRVRVAETWRIRHMSRIQAFNGAVMSSQAAALGNLPEWNLADLYPSPASAEFAADLKRGEAEAKAFAEQHRGKLATLSGEELAKAVETYEALSDLLGRLGSYAQLHYVGDTSDPQRAKFYGDANAKLTDISTLLLFFELEINRIEDEVLDKLMAAPRLAHYRPWIENLRKEKPYQLEHRLEELFLEKSQTGYAAWNRLFDETMADLRFTVEGEALSLEPALTLLLNPQESKRKAAAEALAETFKQNLR